MDHVIEEIKTLFAGAIGTPVAGFEKIPQSGSDRFYFRINTKSASYIATYGKNIRENDTFIYFSRHFRSAGSPVPQILAVNEQKTIYIQEDFGDISLLNKLDELGFCDEVYALFQASLSRLAHLQINGDRNLDYSRCITSREFGKQAILSDLLYFKYYFLDTLQIPYDKERLLEEFDQLGNFLSAADHKYFMFRDFQSRNLMVKEDQIHFIDYQGGMKGALQYDVASLLWQARADLPDEWKTSLLNYYIGCVEEKLSLTINRSRFTDRYNGYVLIRLLQVLGAYGFRGLFERKAHFLTSIPLALKNLGWFIKNKNAGIELPELDRLLKLTVAGEVMQRFQPLQATDETPLVVRISSFSYKKGIPVDESGNGGGFIFDCRGLLNPGRFTEYKNITGRDKPVKDFLEQKTKMPEFLNSVYSIVDISVEDYLKRSFKDLQVSFGCTGGQHRSVYAADSLVRHLKNKFKVKIELNHVEQEAKNWINS
ncbi:MAG: phosphotransferase [Chitinophagaceae bacterium]|nr:phosphotransferase [Chitinophagaceae bacterium]